MSKSVTTKKKVVQHTPKERLAMRRKKRKEGPSGLRRAERRKHLQGRAHTPTEAEMADLGRPEEPNGEA